MPVDTVQLRREIEARGHTWLVRAPPPTEHHALGRLPGDPAKTQQAVRVAETMLASRVRLKPLETLRPEDAATTVSVAAAIASVPKDFDWRSHGIIGRGRCGNQNASVFVLHNRAGCSDGVEGNRDCRDLVLSASDQHFCSSHGPNCGGWNENDALGQIKSRGVVPESAFPYMTGFDNPPKVNTADPEHTWLAYCRPEMNRKERRYRIADYSAWPSSMSGIPMDARKYYLANFGPMAMGFTVYEDFDNYGGGVYKHTTGKVRGGHCVLVIGYSDTNQAWICRNSWGTAWGGSAHADGTGDGFFMIGTATAR